GPAAVPYLWMFFTSIFCAALVVQAATRRSKPDPVPGKIGFVILFVGWLVAYLAAIETIGYFVSSFVFLVGSMYVLTYRNHLVIFAVATGWVIFAYFVFAQFLFIPLPIGPLLQPILE
ncbi:MAG: tripartite tricarboxylate transporter TctB family protein, partial [Planctomycetota bacterium]